MRSVQRRTDPFALIVCLNADNYNKYYFLTENEVIIARSIHEGLSLRFPCNDRRDEVNKLFIIWPF